MTSPLTASIVLVLNGSCRLQCCDINVVVAVGTGNWVQFHSMELEFGMDNMDCKFAICIGLEFVNLAFFLEFISRDNCNVLQTLHFSWVFLVSTALELKVMGGQGESLDHLCLNLHLGFKPLFFP